MTIDSGLLAKVLRMQKTLFSSLRLKDVLDSALVLMSEVAGKAKVAIFLSDNDSLSLKLMNSYGYQETTIETLRVLPFTAETLLKSVVQKRQMAIARTAKEAPDVSMAIMRREQSEGQISLPLVASNLLVGAILIDVIDPKILELKDVLKDVANLVAIAVGNSILFGRSEYERDRLATLYKTSVLLSGSSLKFSEVLQITADTALILGNTPHCAILVLDKDRNAFHVSAFKGLDGGSLHEFDLKVDDTIAGKVIASGKTEYVADAHSHQGKLPRPDGGQGFGSVLAVPISYEHDPMGVLMVFCTEMRGFHREQTELLESLSQQASQALSVALMHESTGPQSLQDAHTGLFNRWHFESSLQKELDRSQRHKHNLSLAIIDIDHLSRVNDLLGQERGDSVIQHVARLIKSSLRDIDLPCRYGAEEFAVVLPETSASAAHEVAERLRQKIRGESAPGIGLITVSIGVASFPSHADNGTDLIKAAEEALDVAKFEGRDRVRLTETWATADIGHIPWEELVRQAKLSVVGERQSRLQNRLTASPEYAPWMRAMPGWGGKKRSD